MEDFCTEVPQECKLECVDNLSIRHTHKKKIAHICDWIWLPHTNRNTEFNNFFRYILGKNGASRMKFSTNL